MGPKKTKRKISDLTAPEFDLITSTLRGFMSGLDQEDEDTGGLVEELERLCTKLDGKIHTPFSSTTTLDLVGVNINVRGLSWKEGGMNSARDRGLLENPSGFLTVANTTCLISLILQHVSQSTEAGCRMLIDIILLHLASTASSEDHDVSIVPGFTVLKTAFDENRSFGGVLDHLITKLPSKYTPLILSHPIQTLARPDLNQIGTSNIIEAKNLVDIRAHIAQVVLAAAVTCRQKKQEYARGAITNGKLWLFFVYRQLEIGGSYGLSEVIELGKQAEGLPLILGLLRDWIDNSHHPELEYFDIV